MTGNRTRRARVLPRLLVSGVIALLSVAAWAPVAVAAASGRVDLRFSESLQGRVTKSVSEPRCTGSPTQSRVVALDGKLGSDEYVLTVYVRGPQPSGRFAITTAPQNAAAVTVQKVGSASSPSTAFFTARSGSVLVRSATKGSVDAELALAGRDPQPLHVKGSWVCGANPSKVKKS